MRFFRSLTLAEHELSGRLEDALGHSGTTVDQWQILNFVADTTGSPMNAIAEHVRLPAPTLTKIIDKMVSSNLVIRRADEYDRRKVLILMSARGNAALADWNSATDPIIEAFLVPIGSADSAKLESLLVKVSSTTTQPQTNGLLNTC